MNRKHQAFVLAFILLISGLCPVQAATLGPAGSYNELLELAAGAADGDIILISGRIAADSAPLVIRPAVTIRSAAPGAASISGLSISDSSVTFSGVVLENTLNVSGTSYIELKNGSSVTGAGGDSGIRFDGNGALLLGADCSVTGGSDGAGVSISHRSGDFYSSLEGTVTGGSGNTGGPGVVVSPLSRSGTMMISGEILGGSGEIIGGHALNLFDLSGNAYITVAGSVTGGSGEIGGDGIQLVSASDHVNVGITGSVKGGEGSGYGGDAMLLMNASGSASISLSGTLSGGNATQSDAQPGTSLLIVGDSTSARTRVDNCILEDGLLLSAAATPAATPAPTPIPAVTPLPAITASLVLPTLLPERIEEEPEKETEDRLPIATPDEAMREENPLEEVADDLTQDEESIDSDDSGAENPAA